jgi:putative phosphoribosyl transferase
MSLVRAQPSRGTGLAVGRYVRDVFPFRDRNDAGHQLASRLAPRYSGRTDLLVLGLPRGGVPVAYAVAKALGAPLDVFVVRKLGVPGHPELAMGALAHGGVRVLNEHAIRSLRIPHADIEAVAARELREVERRERTYRGARPFPQVAGRTVILVDDGLATGASMRAAALALRQLRPGGMVVAVPVAAASACNELREEVDEVVCAFTPEPFEAVGAWYQDFRQTTDDQVREFLGRSRVAQA